MGPVRHCNHIIGEKRGGCFAFHWFVRCVVCHSLCALPLGIIGRLFSLITALPRHLGPVVQNLTMSLVNLSLKL